MNKVIGTVETKQVSVLQSDHHIITAVKIADDQAAYKAGCVLYEDSGAYKALGASDSEHKAVAVALEDLGETANQACCACVPYNGIYNKYLFYYLMPQKNYRKSRRTKFLNWI